MYQEKNLFNSPPVPFWKRLALCSNAIPKRQPKSASYTTSNIKLPTTALYYTQCTPAVPTGGTPTESVLADFDSKN